ncbi:hypothetical protein [Haloarcula montana]|uniref:hypothetical protein n=1 Tax=Haloarcula montana TaxID=3111776 RepID=UPI002D78C8A3|nr:hypothetical protein [Haloarcula sp. GH36]
MATSVEVDEETKDRLERLQAEIRLETGTTVTQPELLDRIVAREFASRDALVDSFRDDWEGLSDAETEQWLAGTAESGDPAAEEDIDRALSDEAVEE